MRKIIFAINISTDGYCGHEGMTPSEDVHKYFTKLLQDAGLILYGRTTYELMVPYWPEIAKNQSESEITNEFARVFDSLDKVLFSTTSEKPQDQNTKLLRGNLIEEAIALKEKPGKDIFAGSLSIASQLSKHDLIDEYRFVIHPVVVGRGPKLFDTVKLSESHYLELVGSETFSSGVVVLHYKKLT
ncbi:dihydrofolate reductase family protein [Leptospira sp. 201903075]|uniref:dihydrofolate reductase family protein n=1 Tax=Leptospira chreensis TaxID=2810035 RepID=UPI0019627D31|nr:dihydrofolate reductase family protein [Leptospira chreensis]MBM9591808.1 dihydrofolate reductase family protein [Leptospira chreensis]MBM9591972.1 dihydrofolate reductase family protein [Leptospira chreensis]